MDGSFWRGLAGAVAIHASVGALLIFTAPISWLRPRVVAPQDVSIDLDLAGTALDPPRESETLPPPDGQLDRPSEPLAARSSALRTVHTSQPALIDSAGSILHNGEVGPDGIGGSDASAASSASEGESKAPGGATRSPRRPIDTGLGGGLHWAVVGPAPSAKPPRPLSATGGLQEALDQRDRAIGLGFGGPAVSAVRSAASGLAAPRAGIATIEVVFDGSGRVESTRLLSANNDFAGWARVAAGARAALEAARIRVPPHSRGLAVTLQVESRTQLPSGTVPGDAVGVRPSGIGVSGEFDVADIGATPTRNVSVRIIGERRL